MLGGPDGGHGGIEERTWKETKSCNLNLFAEWSTREGAGIEDEKSKQKVGLG